MIRRKHRDSGFSLVEMMVALVAGLVVIGSTLTFTVSMLRSNSQNIQASRLTQDLRTAMNLVVRELRRSGYDADAYMRTARAFNEVQAGAVNTPYSTSSHASITINGAGDCVLFRYDRPAGGSEFKGFQLSATGNLQHIVATAAPSCGTGTDWVDVSDSNIIEITSFSITSANSDEFSDVIRSSTVSLVDTPSPGQTTARTTTTTATVTVRNYNVQMVGRLRGDTAVSRAFTQQVRVRGDHLRLVKNITDVVTGP